MTAIKLIKEIARQEREKIKQRRANDLSIEAYRAPIMGTQIKRR